MPRPAIRSMCALVVPAATAVLVLGATRPRLTGGPTAWSGEDLAWCACWMVALVWTARLTAAAGALSFELASHGVVDARRALRWAPPVARYALRAALAGSLAVAPPPPVTVHIGPDGHLVPVAPPTTPTTSTTTRASAPRQPSVPARPTTARMHRVQPGDNLWSIARAALARRVGREPEDRETAPYWLRLIAANRATLRSGDPNLIYPGEIVELPNP